jgi:multidrug efflux pump subunit AcrA (membrane-fusion protein)
MLVRAAFHPGGNTTDGPVGGSGAAQNLALFVRVDSLFDRSQQSARVWFVEGDRIRVRTLTLGPDQREGHIQVIEGLRPGDQVVLPPFDDLEENQRIKLPTSP